jgi:hypothetical protein
MKSEITFALSNPIEYSKGGEFYTCHELTLLAPSYNNRKQCQKLKQLFFKIVKDNAEKNKDESDSRKKRDRDDNEDNVLEGSDITTIFFMSDVDIDEVMDIFEKLLISGVCKLDDSITLNNSLMGKMSLGDIEKIFGEYMSNFLVQSL